MNYFLLIKNNLKITNVRLYLIVNILLIFIFGFLYYINDYFISNNIQLAKKFNLVSENYDGKDDKSNEFLYYLWWSLVTQTTVGYSGLLNERTGENIPFSKIYYYPFKVLNILQLFSVIFVNILLI